MEYNSGMVNHPQNNCKIPAFWDNPKIKRIHTYTMDAGLTLV